MTRRSACSIPILDEAGLRALLDGGPEAAAKLAVTPEG